MVDTTSKRKLAAILSADVVGYSRLMADNEAATVTTLQEYRAAVGRVIDRHDGRVVNAPGDNILAEFASAVEAVQAAVELQRNIEGRNAELEEARRMHFRVGVNLGDVIEEDDGTIYGDGVNIAARLEALADAGGICISNTVYESVEGKLDFGFDFLGAQQVKNIAKPVNVYRVRAKAEEAPRPATGVPAAAASRLRRILVIAAAGAIVTVIGGVVAWQASRAPEPTEVAESPSEPPTGDAILALPTGPSIGVLPFVNMSGDPEQDYFVDGMTEDIITELARFPELTVLARNTTFRYKGTTVDISQIGRELGVKYVLEGSVRKSGDQLRITAQLIDVRDGSHIWAERYDEHLTEMFAVQDQITGRIVGAIVGGDASVIERTEREISQGKRRNQMVAYDFVLRARAHRPYRKDEYLLGKALLEKAVEADPNYARSYHELAWYMLVGWFYRFEDTPLPPEEIKKAAIRSVELDPTDARAHRTAAYGYFFDKQLDLFEYEARRAFELSPYNAEIFAHLGMPISFTGQWKRGYQLVRKGYELNKESVAGWYHTTTFYYHYFRGEYRQAIEVLHQHPSQEILETAMKYVPAYGQLGDAENAKRYWQKCVDLEPDWSTDRMRALFHLWNFKEQDIEKVMEGVHKGLYAKADDAVR